MIGNTGVLPCQPIIKETSATNLSVPYERAHVAASVVGPKTVEALLDALIPLADRIAAGPGTRDPAISEFLRGVERPH